MWHCLESDVVANQQEPPRFPAVLLIGQTPFVSARTLLDVVVACCPMENFGTTSSRATQPLIFANTVLNQCGLAWISVPGIAFTRFSTAQFTLDDARVKLKRLYRKT